MKTIPYGKIAASVVVCGGALLGWALWQDGGRSGSNKEAELPKGWEWRYQGNTMTAVDESGREYRWEGGRFIPLKVK